MRRARARRRGRYSSMSRAFAKDRLTFSRGRRLLIEPLEERTLLSLAPLLVDLQPESDSGLYSDDNLTNVRAATIDITAVQSGDVISVYRQDVLLGQAAQVEGTLYRYGFLAGQLQEGPNSITARSFDGVEESADSPALAIALDTIGPRITASTPTAPVNLRTTTLDSVTVTFSEAIDFDPAGGGTFGLEDVTITGPEGAITPTGISSLDGNEYQVAFGAQTERGIYRISVGPVIADLAGNPMDQDADGQQGEANQDLYAFTFSAYSADTVFTSTDTISESNTALDGQHIAIIGTTVAVDGPHSFGSVQLIGSGVLTHTACTATETHKLDITVAEQVIVDLSSRITADGKGYGAESGTGAGKRLSDAGSGAGYGGAGGNSSYGPGGGAYGSLEEPLDLGSGGGSSPWAVGGGGGGAIRLVVFGTLTVDGELSADGNGTSGTCNGGGGAGGSIYVTVGSLAGGGVIGANGGFGNGERGGGGGGGRIAIYYEDASAFDLAHVTALGGTGYRPGQPGTIYLNAPDAAPFISEVYGGPRGLVRTPVDHVDVAFTRPIDPSTLAANTRLWGPEGNVPVSSIALVDAIAGRETYRLAVPLQIANGTYRLTVTPGVRGANGKLLDQDHDGTGGEAVDEYQGTFTLDTVGPRITRHVPAGDNAGTVDRVDVWFSEPINTATLTLADIVIAAPSGSIAPTGVSGIGINAFRITFAAQTAYDQYHVRIGPDVADLAGNPMDQDHDQMQGELTDDVYDASFNLVDVDLTLYDVSVAETELWAGEPIHVSWSGKNASGYPFLGDWTDAVYLSQDDQWDISDVLLTTVPHTGGLLRNAKYSQSVPANIPGVLPGQYYVIVRADLYNQERQAGEVVADNIWPIGPLPLGVRPLATDGAPASGTLTDSDRSDYYAIHTEKPGSLSFLLDGLGAGAEFFVSYQTIPSRLRYDSRSTPNPQGNPAAIIAATVPGTYYSHSAPLGGS